MSLKSESLQIDNLKNVILPLHGGYKMYENQHNNNVKWF